MTENKQHHTTCVIKNTPNRSVLCVLFCYKNGDTTYLSNNMSSHHVAAASSDSATIKKEEEEEKEKDDLQKKHGADVNKNCDSNNRLVLKKEEEEEEEMDGEIDGEIDDYYADWKVGNWCWVLPSTTTVTCNDDDGTTNNHSVTSSSECKKRTASTRSSHNTSSVNNKDTTPKKKKARSLSPHLPSNRNNTNIKREDDDNSSFGRSTKEQNDNDDSGDGYESWTEGNWCWLLPTKRRKQPPIRAKHRNCCTSSSQNSSCVDDPNPDESNELDKNNFDDDNDDNDDGRNTIAYTKKQNKRWNEMFQRLVSYKNQYNSINVPRIYAVDLKLGRWVNTQRGNYRDETISDHRVELLNSIGFVWNTLDNSWDKMFQRLVTYRKQHHGSTIVPKNYESDIQLANWVLTQRKYYKKTGILSVDRIERLESIDFVWDPFEEKWMAMYDRLVTYKKKHKSTQVKYGYTEENQQPYLGCWVNTQRVVYHNGKLLKKRLELLNSIDFAWEATLFSHGR